MQVYEDLDAARPIGKSAVALGFFDGLHLGHQAVIRKAAAWKEKGLLPEVFTFTIQHAAPQKKAAAGRLLTERHKWGLLGEWGIQMVLSPAFTAFQAMEPEEFVRRVLVEKLDAGAVCCGDDFRFGCRAAGDVGLLREICTGYGIQVDVAPEVTVEGERVSSTAIRALLQQGEAERANRMLGRAFGYDFEVVHGKRLGRTIDSPTINQRLPEDFLCPRHGVYASVTQVGGTFYPSVTNIGLRPTVENTRAVNSETYICGFSGDLYGKHIPVRLLRFLRPEMKFPSVEALRARIQADAAASEPIARQYIQKIILQKAD